MIYKLHRKQFVKILISVTTICICVAAGMPSANGATQTPNRDSRVYSVHIDLSHPELELFKHLHLVKKYPVALGKLSTQTPIGNWKVTTKQKEWGGGFGSRWLGLNVPWGTYGIHGTNNPDSIGRYASNGCIRMKNSDVEELYNILPIGTPVRISGDPLRPLRRLEYGNIGADVELVQCRLKELGFFQGRCDGKFGPATQFALTYFQLAYNLPMVASVGVAEYRTLGLRQRNSSTMHRSTPLN